MSEPTRPTLAEPLAKYLSQARWFAGKGRDWRVAGTTTLAWLREELPAVRIELVTVEYAEAGGGAGTTELYQVPLVHHETPVEALSPALVGQDDVTLGRRTWVYDALHDRSVTGLWLQGIAGEARVGPGHGAGHGAGHGEVRFSAAPDAEVVPAELSSRVVAGEQSNTSLVFGDVAILKVFRRLTPGLNPDIELHLALQRAASAHIAAPLGWVAASWPDPGQRSSPASPAALVEGSLALLQQFLRSGADGWELALASVRDLFGEADLHADEVGGDFAGESFRLGAATAEVHADLARTLPTGLVGPEELAARAAAMHRRLDRAAAEVPELASYAPDLRPAYDALSELAEPVPVQRVHGDLHLGQVLRTAEGWKLLDFEGEPARPLAERRALDSPLRDVAGMLRSFDYAARHLLTDGGPAEGSRDHQLGYRAAEWAERNRQAFCDGYEKAGNGAGLDPRSGAGAVLLRAFETDKAVYEVVYEAGNRPSWVRVPLAAVERLAGGGAPVRRRSG